MFFSVANFKNKYDNDRSAKLRNIDVYIGNSSTGIYINDTTNITDVVANMQRLNSYVGSPTSGDSVIVRAPSDYVSTARSTYFCKCCLLSRNFCNAAGG